MNSPRPKWYKSLWGVVLLLAAFGPFALPFVWKSNQFNTLSKWLITIGVIVFTIVLGWTTWLTIKLFIEQLKTYGLIS
jgi:hypothetical protein